MTIANFATSIDPGAADEAGQTLTFLVTNNSNPDLFSSAPAIAADGTLSYTAAADANGTATITVQLMDDGGTADGGDDTSPTQDFTVTVNPVNDEPQFTIAADPPTILQDSGAQSVAGFATNILPGPATATDEVGQVLSFVLVVGATTGDLTFDDQPAIDPATGQLTYTPTAGTTGTANITVVLNDDGGTANGGDDTSDPQQFTINVTPINSAPSFTLPDEEPSSLEDADPVTIAGFASNIEKGAPADDGQTLTFDATVTSTVGNLAFIAGPAIDPITGDLTYTAAPNTNGSANVAVFLMDDGGTANGGDDTSDTQQFTITVNEVNDAPSFTMTADPPAIIEDSGAQSVAGFATAISPGPTDELGQVLTFTLVVAQTTDNISFEVAPAIDPLTGELTYTADEGTFGTATVDVFLMDDGGTANGGDDTSETQQFTITVTPLNSAPSFTLPNEQPGSLEDALPVTIAGFASNIDPGAPADAGQILTFFVSNDNEDLFTDQPTIDPDTGDLTYTAAPDANGTADVDVFLMDDGGTINGGADTSGTQQFTITVGAVNDAPSFAIAADPPTIVESSGAQAVAGFATNIVPGPLTATDESGQLLTFTLLVAGTTGGLTFEADPAIDPVTGDLTYTADEGTFGTATVDVFLMDDGGTDDGGVDQSPTQQFTITVTPINSAPSFTLPDEQPSSLEDALPVTIAGFASNIDKGAPEDVA